LKGNADNIFGLDTSPDKQGSKYQEFDDLDEDDTRDDLEGDLQTTSNPGSPDPA